MSWRAKNRGLRCRDCGVPLLNMKRDQYRDYRVFVCRCGARWAFNYKGWHTVDVEAWNSGEEAA